MPLKSDREYRRFEIRLAEPQEQDADEGMIVEGYATTFNDPYVLWEDSQGTVREQVASDAFSDADMSDVIMQYDHQGRVFARLRNGTLQLAADEHGLKIRANLGGTSIGRQLYEEIKGGYTDRMSFGFTVEEEKREEYRDETSGRVDILRTITRIRKLYDVSAVSLPANDGTEISARSYGEGAIAKAVEELHVAEERARRVAEIRELLKGGLQNDS